MNTVNCFYFLVTHVGQWVEIVFQLSNVSYGRLEWCNTCYIIIIPIINISKH